MFTASHNPPEWNGLKVFHGDGSLLLDDETRQIETEANALSHDDVIKLELDLAEDAGIVEKRDFTNEYVDAVEKLIDLNKIRKAGLKVIVDPMYGVGQLTLGTVLTEARCRVTFIHERHNPLFGGRSPAPNEEALRLLSSEMQEGNYDLGLAMDGDADRIAILDERGRYISINDMLLLLYWYLHEVRGERGGVVRNLSTTHLLDRLAKKLGEQCYETPVGFKHIVSTMVEHNAVLGGESSGGLTIRGHILGKDGIFACALVVEMLARTGPEDLGTCWSGSMADRPLVLRGREPARDAGDAHCRAQADERSAQQPHRALPGGKHLAHRRHQAFARKRQLGAAAVLRHRAGAAAGGGGRLAREGEGTAAVAAPVRNGENGK